MPKQKHYERIVKALKKKKNVKNPWAVAHVVENKSKRARARKKKAR